MLPPLMCGGFDVRVCVCQRVLVARLYTHYYRQGGASHATISGSPPPGQVYNNKVKTE